MMRGGVWVRAERGFSLIELIGVLAIMGILASMTVPPILRQIRQAQSGNEEANLNEVARAIVEGIKATNTIPNPNTDALNPGGWATISLPYTALGTNQLLYVTGTSVNQQRRMYLSGGLANYFNINGIIPPFTTPASGWPTNSFPADLQIVLASSSREDMVLNCSTVANLASNDVVWLKNYVKTPDANGLYIANNANVVPSSWSNRGEFLHVKTVDLRPLFCRVELIDTACPPTATSTTFGSFTYTDPSINFFGAAAVFDIRDSNLSPIAARALIVSPRADITVLGNPQPQYLDRASALAAGNLSGQVGTGGTAPAQVTPALNPQPRFRIPISGSVSPPPAGMFPANIQTFYVLKGTALQLWDDAGATPVLTTTIESDCSFKYFGTTWSRVD